MGRNKKYNTPEEKREAARAAQKRYYESHQAQEQAKARERWWSRGSAQRKARREGQGPNSPSSEYHLESDDDFDDEEQGTVSGPSSLSDIWIQMERYTDRLYRTLRPGGENASETTIFHDQAREAISLAGSTGVVPPNYAYMCNGRLANASRIIREACAMEADARARDPSQTNPVQRRIRKLIRSATKHEAFDTELGLFLRMDHGIIKYARAYQAGELSWQQQSLS